MQLLTYTDYALRVLLYVASQPGRPVPTSRVAEAFGVSSEHVAKAAKALTRLGYLRSTRGVGGGIQLARSAKSITVGEVVRAFEEGRHPVPCLAATSDPRCVIAPACRLREALARAEAAFYRELDGSTLADLVANRPVLVRLLNVRPLTA